MDYPHGHVGHHRHHNRRGDDDDFQLPPPQPPFSHSPFPPPPHVENPYAPPPPSYVDAYNQPPPPPPPHHQTYQPQPPQSYGGAYNPPPPPGSFHSSPAQPPSSYPHHYESGGPTHHTFLPHMPGSHSHHGSDEYGSSTHNYGGGVGPGPGPDLGHLENKPSHQIHCKAGGESYVFGIRDGKVVLTHPDSSDLTQHWYKDEKYSTKVKDKDGHPSFMLVNKGTGQAVKTSVSCHPVQLTPYKPDVLDESVLWTESKDLGSGYRMIRTVNNVHLVMDAWNADKDHGGIHDGTVIAIYETWKGDNKNQQWKFVRH